MRIIEAKRIKDAVSSLSIRANIDLRTDVLAALKKAKQRAKTSHQKEVLGILIDNANIASKKRLAICQDTGIAVVYLEIGQNVIIKGDLKKAVNDGVRDGYRRGYLRKSIVSDPLLRKNTGNNTPAVIHYGLATGGRVKITVMPKGFGCENTSQVKMLKPTAGIEGIKDFIISVVRAAGPDACPPYIIGVGMGGTQEKAAALAKEALLIPLEKRNPKKIYAALEREILKSTNSLGVKILTYPTHIAGLPVAVNISCHALRSATKTL
ncbi:MAG: fumarate hydratase [Candidatus Omnitrophota bacterium]